MIQITDLGDISEFQKFDQNKYLAKTVEHELYPLKGLQKVFCSLK